MNMYRFFLEKGKRARSAVQLYSLIVQQARHPDFYLYYGVPDTLDGRFDMICLHAFLVMERLGREGPEGKKLAQALFDGMFRDMERSLRERGVGDLSIPKHVKRMMKGFNGRAKAYHQAFQDDPADGALEGAILRNLYRGVSPDSDRGASEMAHYVRECVRALGQQDASLLTQEGRVLFPAVFFSGGKDFDERDCGSRMVA